MPLIFGDDNMAVFSIIKLSELEGAKILAPEFYHPDKIRTKRYLENACTKKIKDCFYNVKEIFDPKITYLTQQGVVFDLSDVTSYFLYGGKKVTSSEEVGSAKKIFFQNDVLISRLRPYLKEVSFIAFNEKLKLASTEFIVLRQKDNHYYPETLFAYLISKELQNILAWSITGTEHPRFNEDYFLKLPLPAFSEDIHKKIKIIVQSAWKIFLKSLDFYSQAENILLEELGLKDFKPRYEKTYTAKLSSAFSAHRIDAEYFQPAYEEVSKKIKEYPNGFSRLLKHVENVKPDFDPTKYPDKIFSYVELADIDSSIGVIHSVNEIKGEEAPSRARRLLKEGDVIVSSVEGSLEKVALVDKEHDGCLASTGFFQFRLLDMLPEVLLVLSKTIVLQSQLKKKCSGTILTAVPKESLRDIVIPILQTSTQQKIASLVQQSHEARRKAKELLEVAKRTVEIAIEKNEKEALDYISKSIV
jgi:restriction endonuclease S subunit